PGPEPDLEALVLAHWQQQAEQIDVRPLHKRICASLDAAASSELAGRAASGHPHRRFVRRLAWGLAAAAALLLAFLGGWQLRPLRVSAETLVQQAQATHRLLLDRCYLVEIRKESPLLDRNPLAVASRVIRVWTRGDRFWIESFKPQRRWAWGRDENGS